MFVALMLAAERIVGTYLLHTDAVAHRLARRVAIIGSGPAALRMAARINAGMQRSFRLVGLFDDRGGKVDGTVEELVVRAREEGIDAVIMNFSPRRAASSMSWRNCGACAACWRMSMSCRP
ncbi:hypothetical protein RAA17_09560 [Komagataeibacter rhaeticus]|nr:hypothetical protein [Komagataeibacter rhaeticus]